MSPPHIPSIRRTPLRGLWFAVLLTRFLGAASWVLLTGMVLWSVGALWFDFPGRAWRHAVAIVYAVTMVGVWFGGKKFRWKFVFTVLGFIVVLAWWLTLQPSNARPWQADVAQTAWAEVAGDRVTLHNVRNCDYRTETNYSAYWETRTVELCHLVGVDLAINYWGSAWMAHPVVSFQFDDAAPVCFSIETRKETGESYSAVGGLYRQYELICICADERDVLRVRTNFRHGEEVFLYHTTVSAVAARQRFLEYVATMNDLRVNPRWYNAATTNCTTTIRTQHAAADRTAWDWRILFNGYLDQMLYEHGTLAGGLPFATLRARARINDAAWAADKAPDFSQRIRVGRPGFSAQSPTLQTPTPTP